MHFCVYNYIMEKEKLTRQIHIRVSEYEKNFIQGLADLYANGNVSLFAVYSMLHVERKMLGENDLNDSNRSLKRGRQAPPNSTKQ